MQHPQTKSKLIQKAKKIFSYMQSMLLKLAYENILKNHLKEIEKLRNTFLSEN